MEIIQRANKPWMIRINNRQYKIGPCRQAKSPAETSAGASIFVASKS
jgi:hypothetical protein